MKNGKNRGQQRFLCKQCKKTFGERFGTPMFGLHTPIGEVSNTLLILMRQSMGHPAIATESTPGAARSASAV